jgi:GH24 family phage-related lysozyme (muramidase)
VPLELKQKQASKFIKSVEGLELKTYSCAKKEMSIGYGTRSYYGGEITPLIANKLFNKYLNNRVWKRVPESMSDNHYTVYSSLVYNIPGHANNLLIKRNWFMRLFTKYDYSVDCKKILNYRKVDGKVNKGIINRRQREYELCVK